MIPQGRNRAGCGQLLCAGATARLAVHDAEQPSSRAALALAPQSFAFSRQHTNTSQVPPLAPAAATRRLQRARFAATVRVVQALDQAGLQYLLRHQLPMWVKVRPQVQGHVVAGTSWALGSQATLPARLAGTGLVLRGAAAADRPQQPGPALPCCQPDLTLWHTRLACRAV